MRGFDGGKGRVCEPPSALNRLLCALFAAQYICGVDSRFFTFVDPGNMSAIRQKGSGRFESTENLGYGESACIGLFFGGQRPGDACCLSGDETAGHHADGTLNIAIDGPLNILRRDGW